MTVSELVAQGVSKMRKTSWALPKDHVEVELIKGADRTYCGPWAKLHSELNDSPKRFLFIGEISNDWEEYHESQQ